VIKHQKYQYPADIYSLSVLMWEIITREAPFKNMGQIEAAGSVALEGKRPPFPKGVPTYVKSMIEKCWSEKPEERMSTEEVIKTLEELENNLTEESKTWINAPFGHPAYDEPTEEEKNAHHSQVVEQKKKPKRMSLFKRAK
jgi:serine/threonine protein kinase